MIRIRLCVCCVAIISAQFLVVGCKQKNDRVEVFKMSAWLNPPAISGDLLIKQVDEDTMLLKHTEFKPVYRYNKEKRQMDLVGSPALWDKTKEPAFSCEAQSSPDNKILLIDPKSDTLVAGGSDEVPTAGKRALRLTQSPDGNKVAVLSANGSKRTSILPFIGGGGANGPYFHEVFSLSGGMIPIGNSRRIPLDSDDYPISVCWSPASKFVLYTNFIFTKLAVIEVPDGEPQ